MSHISGHIIHLFQHFLSSIELFAFLPPIQSIFCPHNKMNTLSRNWNLSLNLERVSSSKPHTSLRAEKALTTLGPKAAVSSTISMGSSLDDNLVSSSLDLTSGITLRSPTKSSNQLSDWWSKGSRSANIKLKPQPPNTKSSTNGQKERETPREAPKHAKRNEIEGQNILTLELSTVEPKRGEERGRIPRPKTKKKRPNDSSK